MGDSRPMKIRLERERNPNRDPRSYSLLSSLPFFTSRRAWNGRMPYVHRIRNGTLYTIHARPHVAFRFWCGAFGFLDKGFLMSELPPDRELCATCEGRAIGAGLVDARHINGRPVIYTPRGRLIDPNTKRDSQ